MFGKLFFTVQSCVVIWLFSFSLPLYFDYGFYAVNIVCFVSLWCIHISCISFPLQKESPLIKFSLVMFFFFNVNCHPYSFLTDTCNFFSLDIFLLSLVFCDLFFLPIFLSQLLMILLKVADISNECRPMDVAEPWLECLLQEFFNQV